MLIPKKLIYGSLFLLLFFGAAWLVIAHFVGEPLRAFLVLMELLLLGTVCEADRLRRRIYTIPILLLACIGVFDQLVAQHQSVTSLGVGLVVGGGFFALQYVLSRGRLVGSGDVFLGLALGLVFGGTRVLAVLLVSYVLGAFISLLLLVFGYWKRGECVPLGAFLALGGSIILFFDTPWTLLGFQAS